MYKNVMAPSSVQPPPAVVVLAPVEGLLIYARVTLVCLLTFWKNKQKKKSNKKNVCVNAQHECVSFCCKYLKLYVPFLGNWYQLFWRYSTCLLEIIFLKKMAKMSFIERVSCFMYLPYLSSEVKEKRVFPNECTCRGRYEMCCLYILQSTYGTRIRQTSEMVKGVSPKLVTTSKNGH